MRTGAQRRSVFVLIVSTLVLIMLGGYTVMRAVMGDRQVRSFEDCVAAGNPVRESYPEVCTTPNGQSFPNPGQQAPALPRYN